MPIDKIKLPDNSELELNSYKTGAIPFGKVDSTSTATAFTATIPGIKRLENGTCVMLHNGVVTSAANFTININGLGAKPSYSNLTNATRDTTIFNVAYTMLFVYDESLDDNDGGWWCYRGYDSNTNTIGYQLRTNSHSLPMTSVTYRYRLLFTSADGEHFVPANNSTSTNATASRTVCQDKIDPFGAIVYYGATASVAAGSRPSATVLWNQYTLSLGYSFNRTGAALTLTSWKPVYVKCAPQTDGSVIIDSTTPYVQDLPTTDDGKIYIFLGVAYSATAIELLINHPVYYYKDGAVRLWTNAAETGNKSITLENYEDWATTEDYTEIGTLSETASLFGISESEVSAMLRGEYDELVIIDATNAKNVGYKIKNTTYTEIVYIVGETRLFGISYANIAGTYSYKWVDLVEQSNYYYVTCDTAADVQYKEIFVGDGVTPLTKTSIIDIKFTYENTVEHPRLSINGVQKRVNCDTHKDAIGNWSISTIKSYDIAKEIPFRVIYDASNGRVYAPGVRHATDIVSGIVLLSNTPSSDQDKAATPYLVQQAVSGKQDTISDLATIRSGAALGATALQSYTETDPTVPSWAKASTKPSYTAAEVGAQPTLVSGTNIKTINNESLLGSGNITINANTSACELLANKVTSLSSSSTDAQYPSAKAVWDTFYQKPSTGIPASDIASGVIPDEWADLSDILIAVYGTTTSAEVEAAITAGKAIYVKRGGICVPLARSLNGYYEFTKSDSGSNYTIKLRQSNNAWSESVTYVPTSSSSKTITTVAPSSSSTDSQVPTSKAVYTGLSDKEDTANKVTSLSSSSTDTEYPSAKCVYYDIHPLTESINPSNGFLPNQLYSLGTVQGSVSFSLATPPDSYIMNHYYWTFRTGSTAPTITWPSGITWFKGQAPTINSNKYYEISVLDGIAVFMEV